MPPRNRQVVSSPEPEPSLTPLQAATSQENFNLDDVPDGDEPGHSDSDRDVGVNDPDAIPMPKGKGAPDIHYFYEKTKDYMVCKLCRYVSYR
jgi:hypothetical protein